MTIPLAFKFKNDPRTREAANAVDPAVLETTVEIVGRVLPSPFIGINQFFNEVAKEAENLKWRIRNQFARQGGSARKADALTLLIEEIVKNNPDVSLSALRKELTQLGDIRKVIQDIDDNEISFLNHGDLPLNFHPAAVRVSSR
jgi:hypothetical protein